MPDNTGAIRKLDHSTAVMLVALKKELPTWKEETVEIDVAIRKIRFAKKASSISVYLSVREGEEGFEVHADWPSGFCRDSYRGFTSVGAEKAIKSAIARATVIEELSLF